ncbi:hypothetical protein ACVGXP_08810, partial [Enterobacter hormaechei]
LCFFSGGGIFFYIKLFFVFFNYAVMDVKGYFFFKHFLGANIVFANLKNPPVGVFWVFFAGWG